MADWDTDDPGDNDLISNYPANERQQRTNQMSIFGQEHEADNNADQGKHKAITLLDQGSDPGTPSGAGVVYTKTVNGTPELFFLDTGGNVIQLTQGGVVAQEVIALPEQNSDPSTQTDTGQLYTKEFESNTELFFQDPNGNVLRLTKKGELAVNLSDNDVLLGSIRTNSFFRGQKVTVQVSSGAATIDWEAGTVFELTLNENIDLTLENMPDTTSNEEQTIYLDVSSNGDFSINLQSSYSIIYPSGNAPDLTANGRDIWVATSHDGSNIALAPLSDMQTA